MDTQCDTRKALMALYDKISECIRGGNVLYSKTGKPNNYVVSYDIPASISMLDKASYGKAIMWTSKMSVLCSVMNDRCIDIHMSYDIGYNTFPESWLCTGKDDMNTQEYKFSETAELIPFDVFMPAMHKLIDDYAMQSKVND